MYGHQHQQARPEMVRVLLALAELHWRLVFAARGLRRAEVILHRHRGQNGVEITHHSEMGQSERRKSGKVCIWYAHWAGYGGYATQDLGHCPSLCTLLRT